MEDERKQIQFKIQELTAKHQHIIRERDDLEKQKIFVSQEMEHLKAKALQLAQVNREMDELQISLKQQQIFLNKEKEKLMEERSKLSFEMSKFEEEKNTFQIQFERQKQQFEEEKKQYEEEKKQFEEERKQFEELKTTLQSIPEKDKDSLEKEKSNRFSKAWKSKVKSDKNPEQSKLKSSNSEPNTVKLEKSKSDKKLRKISKSKNDNSVDSISNTARKRKSSNRISKLILNPSKIESEPASEAPPPKSENKTDRGPRIKTPKEDKDEIGKQLHETKISSPFKESLHENRSNSVKGSNSHPNLTEKITSPNENKNITSQETKVTSPSDNKSKSHPSTSNHKYEGSNDISKIITQANGHDRKTSISNSHEIRIVTTNPATPEKRSPHEIRKVNKKDIPLIHLTPMTPRSMANSKSNLPNSIQRSNIPSRLNTPSRRNSFFFC